MPQSFVNPFTPQTPIGAGLQNIAMALFAGQQGDAQARARAAAAEASQAHGDLYREQTRKTAAERAQIEQLTRAAGNDAQDEVAAAAAGMPTHTFRAIRDGLNGTFDLSAYQPDEVARAQRGILAVRPAYADKTIDPVNIARALDALKTTDTRDAVIGGRLKPTDVAQAFYAVSGKAPFDNMGGTGTFNNLTGDSRLNPLGEAKVGAEKATANSRNAQAFRDTQHGRQYQIENTAGTKLGAPVQVWNAETNGPMLASPIDAAMLRLPPVPDAPRGGAGGAGAGGAGATTETAKPLPALKISRQDADLILGGLDRAAGTSLKGSPLESELSARAQMYFKTPGTPGYGSHDAAAREALADLAPNGIDSHWYGPATAKAGEGKANAGALRMVGPTTTTTTAVKNGGAAPKPAPAGAPAAAPAKAGEPLYQGRTKQEWLKDADAALSRATTPAQKDAIRARLNKALAAPDA